MYLTIGETKLRVGQYGEGLQSKLELSFEYAFASHKSYRRFAQVLAEGNGIKIKLKSEFTQTRDCLKLSRLVTGVAKLSTPENFALLREILNADSTTDPEEFIARQLNLIEYFT